MERILQTFASPVNGVFTSQTVLLQFLSRSLHLDLVTKYVGHLDTWATLKMRITIFIFHVAMFIVLI